MLEEHWQKECLAPNSLLESGLLSIFERNVESPPSPWQGPAHGAVPWQHTLSRAVWLWYTLCALIPVTLGAKSD